MSFADQIDVFYGRVTACSAQVYVRLGSLGGGGEWSITGHVRGPIARGTRTLPTTVPLADLGPGATLLAACTIPDPTFWTTQLPSVYELDIQLRRGGQVVESVNRSLGIRLFGASGPSLRWLGKRWVLRGISTPDIAAEEIEVFGNDAGVLVTTGVVPSILAKASALGVLCVVKLSRVSEAVAAAQLRSLSGWPAVAMVLLPSELEVADPLRAAAPNIVFAQHLDPAKRAVPADGTQVVFCDVSDDDAFAKISRRLALPIVAVRRLNGDGGLLEARRECDRLQHDLAPIGDFAGYVAEFRKPGEIGPGRKPVSCRERGKNR